MSVFEFVQTLPLYRDRPFMAARLTARHRFVVQPFLADIKGARVLDLGCHDGRWSYAFAKAGADQVIGIEQRSDMIARFSDYPDAKVKGRVRLQKADMLEATADLSASGELFDVVALLGVFYHTTSHYQLLANIRKLAPKLIIIDGEFSNTKTAAIELKLEPTGMAKNAGPEFAGQDRTVVGIPSRPATTLMAHSLGYAVTWADWATLPVEDRGPVQDYFQTGPSNRTTCALRPI